MDTLKSIETGISIDFPAFAPQFNRTLLELAIPEFVQAQPFCELLSLNPCITNDLSPTHIFKA